MAQIFPRWTNELPLRMAVGGAVLALLVVAGIWYYFSPQYTDVGYQPVQPVAYSHKLHAGDLGINCLYCHRTVKRDSPALAVIRDSATSGQPVRWVRVHNLPGFAHFDHRPHLRAGVGCSTCHGRIDQMEVVAQAEPLSMSWCLDCHRNPDPYLRPADEVTNMDWSPPRDQLQSAARIKKAKRINPPVDCTGCHRRPGRRPKTTSSRVRGNRRS